MKRSPSSLIADPFRLSVNSALKSTTLDTLILVPPIRTQQTPPPTRASPPPNATTTEKFIALLDRIGYVETGILF